MLLTSFNILYTDAYQNPGGLSMARHILYGGMLDCVRDECHMRRTAASSKWQEVLAIHSVSLCLLSIQLSRNLC